jgi:DNA-binding NtrC family response regulator
LFYRINVVEVKVPSLRERKEDILPLMRYFLKRKASKFEIPIPEINQDYIDTLLKYDWPGNVRELENVTERMVLLDGKLPGEAFLKKGLQPELPVSEKMLQSRTEVWNLEEQEKIIIQKALRHFENNISKTAEALGLSRNTLYLKMKKYRVQPGV